MAVDLDRWVRKVVTLERTAVAAIKSFRFRNEIESESEAIRRLLRMGLEAEKHSVPPEGR